MGFRWGVQWWKVGSGGAMLLIFGGITLAGLLGAGTIYIWPAVMAFVGLLTMLAGFIGEEGVW